MEEIELRARCPQCEALTLLVIGAAAGGKIPCSRCGAVLLDYEPVRGYVYILSNAHMPGLVKVGFTTRAVEERVAELNSGTAVPAPFVIEAIFPSGDPERHEQEVHDRLASTRLPGREFFRITSRCGMVNVRRAGRVTPERPVAPLPHSTRRRAYRPARPPLSL